jgi:glycosyltransferase involved in cell wall biosynthesis
LEKNLLKQTQADSYNRHLSYASYFNKLYVIVLNLKKEINSLVKSKNNLNIYPTNSLSKWNYVGDAIRIAEKIIENNKIDVISCQDPFVTAVVGTLLKIKYKIPLNIQIHNDYSSIYWKNESLQNKLFSILLPITLRFADTIRLVSESLKNLAKGKFMVGIIPISVESDFFLYEKNNKNIDVICTARLIKQKNIQLLIDSISLVVKKHKNLKVVIIGEGPEKDSLKTLIINKKLSNNIKLIGSKNRKVVNNYLQKSKIFVLPSSYEGWGLSVVEAALCELPVVMTDTGGAREIVVNNKSGFIVKVGSKQAIANKINILLKSQNKRELFGKKGRQHILKYYPKAKLERDWINHLKNTSSLNKKTCFILPEFNTKLSTHYTYTLKLFNKYAKHFPSALFIEKGEPLKPNFSFSRIIIQKITLKPFNLLERFFWLLRLRFQGYHTFFIHYSYWSLFILNFISLFFPTRIFYWHAEELFEQDLNKMNYWERYLLTLAIRTAPNLITAGEKLKQAYAKTFSINPNKIFIVPNWVSKINISQSKDELRKQLNLPQNKKIILFVHRLSERKGAQLLPEIIDKTVKNNKDVFFVIVGEGPLRLNLKINLDKNLSKLVGSVPQKNIVEYYQTANLLIMPSLREGFPRVILEAMAVGLPIVTTDVGEVKNILPTIQHKFIVKPNNINEFVERLNLILKDNSIYSRIATANTEKVKNYSLQSSLNKLIKTIS